ncbi:cytochrome P450 [Coprinopsis sp. MPI-PUGE-AT-0042]|nr:cytochrome P450 [Coprinopsis sp. MPI-PUGE-AT-0042]
MSLEYLGNSFKNWLIAGSGFAVAYVLLRVARGDKHGRLPLPPGPKGLPVIGNLLDIPQDKPWLVYNEWAKKYGDVMYFHALGQKFVVLNSLEAVNDLLNARAANYSDRVQSAIIDMSGAEWTFVVKQHDDEWREHRRTFHRFFNQTQTAQFRPVVGDEVSKLLYGLLATPQAFQETIKEFFALIIMRVSYGFDDPKENQHLIRQADTFNHTFMVYTKPGRLLVGVLPILRYVPSWFPGAGWKGALRNLARLGDTVNREPFDKAKARFESGIHSDQGLNVATRLIADLPPPSASDYPHKEEVARQVTGLAYIAGIDTTESSARGLIYALASNQEVQRKAQEEMDRVVGVGRLPEFSDLDQLHYIQALVKEVSRWYSVLPLCVPHVSTHEDSYKGYRIPEKTIILPNTWAIMHDPEYFDEPMAFKPERYLKDGKINHDVVSPEAASFGYGRRICPGRHFSGQALTMMVASVLACFDIKPPKDEKGREVEMGPMDVVSLLIASPAPFDCSFVPRSPQHAQLIRNMADGK